MHAHKATITSLVWAFLAAMAPASSRAQTTCNTDGRGEPCTEAADCEAYAYATTCANNTCQIPCNDDFGDPQPSDCFAGETCTQGLTDTGTTHFCRPGPFLMDLNLLDMCLYHFQEGAVPDVNRTNVCAIEKSLNLLLDRDGNQRFNIFDVDGCIRALLYLDECDPDTEDCPLSSADCGYGLHYDPDQKRCVRQCGYIANRGDVDVEYFDRPCFGYLTQCDYATGHCDSVDPTTKSCMINDDCPSGAYCLLGRCAAQCSRAIDCPEGDWYCNDVNECAPVPVPSDDTGFVFKPKEYSVHFRSKSHELTAIGDEKKLQQVIMNLHSKRQVFDNPVVTFGYRLEMDYDPKQTAFCEKVFAKEDATADELASCYISPGEEFVTLQNPFGILKAQGTPGINIRLNHQAVRPLDPGTYTASLTAIYNNGVRDRADITFRKHSLSGGYAGQISVYYADPEKTLLGNTSVQMRLQIATGLDPIAWQTLLEDNNIATESPLVDLTEGYPVVGYIEGNSSPIFNAPEHAAGENKIPIRGIYSAHLSRMRLIAVIDVPAVYCRSEAGACSLGSSYEMSVSNFFGRDIRRVIQFVGPYDALTRRFNGIFRDRITGLAPDIETMDGGFILSQVGSKEAEVDAEAYKTPPLSSSPTTTFPDDSNTLLEVQEAVNHYCDEYAEDKALIGEGSDDEEAGFAAYMNQLDTGSPILDNLVDLNSEIQTALDSLDTGGAGQALTLFEFLQGQIYLCPEDGSPPQGQGCIEAAKAHCGLALYRKAMLKGWVNSGQLGESLPSGDELFCSPGSIAQGCNILAADRPNLVGLQEHNRFYAAIAQAIKYQAAADLSEAFYTMYRHANESIEQAEALSEKEEYLLRAWDRYAQLQSYIFSPASSQILFGWPMAGFKGKGQAWINQIHSVLADRLEVLSQLIDLKRRVFLAASGQDYEYIQHVMHLEYLAQAFMLALQHRWQGMNIQYTGQGPEALALGNQILAQLNTQRNPLGFHPNQVFFENSNLGLKNWQNYKSLITQGGTSGRGLLGDVQTSVNTAIAELRGALTSTNSLEAQLLANQQLLEDELDRICGADEPFPGEDKTCEGLSAKMRDEFLDCTGPECEFVVACETNSCENVTQQFRAAAGAALDNVACNIDTPNHTIGFGTIQRHCVKGHVGSLLEEKARLDIQRKGVYRNLKTLLEQIEDVVDEIKRTDSRNDDYLDKVESVFIKAQVIEKSVRIADMAFSQATAMARGANCLIIAGTAAGTSCVNSVVAAVGEAVAASAMLATKELNLYERDKLFHEKELKGIRLGNYATYRGLIGKLVNLVRSVRNLETEYELITQQVFSLHMRIADNLYYARQSANHYQQNVSQVIDHLTGSEQGNVLRRNSAVQVANAKFQDLLRLTYKMAIAYVHSYNLEDQMDVIQNKVFQIVTTNGVEQFIDMLHVMENEYCGASGIDCDAENNVSTLRFSLRDELFPNLVDKEDLQTGGVLTKGEQFHNILLSTYRKTRIRGPLGVEQVEVPFSIKLWDNGTGTEPDWTVSPLECNHIIVGKGNGTIGINIIGTRLQNMRYELQRENIDYIRGCELENIFLPGSMLPIVEYPVREYTVGYAPQSSYAQQDAAPIFETRSGFHAACRNRYENTQGIIEDEGCYRFFARDRSLGSLDWKLVVPLTIEGNEWIMGDGLPEDERPIIEDVVLYFRYRSRPTSN